jgi:hypothetical protein
LPTMENKTNYGDVIFMDTCISVIEGIRIYYVYYG